MATAMVPAAVPALEPHRFTVADYYRMLEAGILHADDRVELLGGQVADSSLARDQLTKAALSAAAGIREVWVVNLPERVLEGYCAPGPGGYRDRQAHGREAHVAPLAFPELRLAVADLLPPGAPERERTPGAESPPERER
jgi:hypothetical protein